MKNIKYLVLGVVVAIIVVLAVNTINKSDDKEDRAKEKSEEEMEIEDDKVGSEEGEEVVYIEYKGEVVNVENDQEKNNTSILVKGENSDNVQMMQEEIMFHLGEGTLLISHDTMEIVKREKLEEGMEISAFFKENTPMTLSIPPQTTPEAIVIHDNEEDGFIKLAHFNNELEDINNELKLNISEETILVNSKGEKVEISDLEDSDLMVFYTVSTRSIPAQTSPEKVIVLDFEDEV